MKVFDFPLAKIAMCFIIGLLAAFYFQPSLKTSLLLLGSILPISLLFFYKSSPKKYFTPVILGVFLCLGISTQAIHNDAFSPYHYSHKINTEKATLIELTLHEKLKNSTSNNRFIARITSLDATKSTGKVLINIRKDSLKNDRLEIGTKLLLKGIIYKHKPPLNPSQFDYGNYLKKKSVYGQIYTDYSQLQISNSIDKNLWHYASIFRNTSIANLKKTGFANEELGIVAALVLGQRQEVSKETLREYQFAGAIHILAVSGLHVGCIMLLIGFILKPIPYTKSWNLIKLIIIIGFLWIFALIAGFSPSVTRAVVMFSFVSVGKYSKRKTNIFHTLLLSMFFILIFEPSFIFDVGFQLSYTAVFFIVWLQPHFASFWKPKYLITQKAWDILSVSFAAQIGILPLSLYYFHQFPSLFFVTNLAILPFLGFILGLGIVVIVLAYLDIVPHFLTRLLELNIFLMNKFIQWIASFESFVLQDISFNWLLLIFSYLMIFGITCWFNKPNFRRLSLALISILLFQITCLKTEFDSSRKEEWIVYNRKKSSLFSERKGKSVIFSVTDSLVETDYEYIIKPYLVQNTLNVTKTRGICNVIYFGSKKILVIDSLGVIPKNAKPDVLVIISSPKINLERILENCRPEIIIADASNYISFTALWKKTCEKEKIPFHAIAEKGFYKIEL